jgi:hypothetical protein
MSQKDQFQTIDPTALATVAGGTGQSPTTGTTDDQVLSALTGILNSLQTMQNGGNNNQQFGVPEMMMLFTIMRNQQQNNTVVAANPYGGYPWGYPYYY